MTGAGLHGRDAELEVFTAALDAVARSGRGLLLVRGEAGIGKTRLLGELRERAAAQRFVVLEGRATELERDAPLVPVVDAIEPALPGDDALSALGAQRLALLSEVLPVPATGGVNDSAPAERWRLHRAVGALLALIADDRPLLLILDDVQWADPATLELLDHLVRRPPADSILLALGLRPSDEADRLLAAQRSSGAFDLRVVELGPLDRSAADELLTGLPAGPERDRRYALSGGNPLLLQELARASGEAVPGGIVAAMGAEIGSLPADAQSLIQGAAIAGDPFELDLAAAVAGLTPPATLAALDVVERAELIRTTREPREFAFRHPVVRTAVYETLGAGERITLHGAAARALAAAGAPAPAQARHLAHAAQTGDAAAAETLRMAAAEVRPTAPEVAADWLLAARRVAPESADPGVLAATLVEAGRLPAALDIIDRTARVTPSVPLAVAGAGVERLLGRHDAAHARLLQALDGTGPTSPDSARLLADLAVGAYQRGDYPEMHRWAMQVDPAAGGDGAVRAAAATLLALGSAFEGDAQAVADGVGVALAAIDEARDDDLGASAELAISVSWGLLALDRLPEGLRVARRVEAAARRSGNGIAAISHGLAVVLALGLLGQITEAEGAADEAEQAARVSGNRQALQMALWLNAWVLLERGRLDPALAAATESVDLAAELDDSASGVVARAVLGAVLGARGEHARARELLASYDIDRGWICRWAPVLVESDLADGDRAAARSHAEHAAALAPGTGMATARAAAGRAQALVALSDGDERAAASLALTAADEAAGAGALLEVARARLVAGRAIVTGDAPAGIAELTQAYEQATRCGAARVEDEARRELRRAGVRIGRGGARSSESAGVASLSGREREISELVADGLTNREIGARLFLSEKTIETHLTRVFQKLGVRSRAQVAAAIARPD